MKCVRALKRVVLLGLLLYLAAAGLRIYMRKYYIWLGGYVRWALHDETARSGPVHIFFFYTDHFEPGANAAIVRRWQQDYPRLADRHRDSTGRALQHTWFYPAEQPIDSNLEALRGLVRAGYGETELHLHHGGDTQESARRRFQAGIAYFQRFGFLKTIDGKTHFAFIHGNWSLDNSRGSAFCGANRELELLRELGCFADFTFPSVWQISQPPTVNNIYGARDDDRPKSYDRGVPLRAGWVPAADLLLFQGPLMIRATADPRKLFFLVDDANIHPTIPAAPWRVDDWVRANVHVEGRPDWVFIKVHGHAASSEADAQETLGPDFDQALTYLEQRYNDGAHYVLHYVTAREAFNLARAAADERTGDPRQYLNYMIPRYAADPGPR